MADNDKKIKFRFEMDETSFSRIKLNIEQLTRSLQELAKVAGSINLPGSGISAGGPNLGSMLGGITGGKQQPGMPGMAQMAKPTNVAGVLTQGLTADRNLFKTVADGSKDALRVMKDALRDTVNEQTRDIARLKKEIDGLASSYNRLKGQSGMQEIAQGDFTAMIGKQRELQNINSARAQNAGTLGGWDAFKNRANEFVHGGISAGGMMGAAGFGIGLVGAGMGAAQWASNNFYKQQESALNYQRNEAFLSTQERAGVMSSFGQNALAIRGGDVGLALAVAKLKSRPDMVAQLGQKGRLSYEQLADIKNGFKVGPSSEIGLATEELFKQGTHTSSQAAKEAMMYQMKPELARQFNQAAQDIANADPMQRARMSEFYTEAQGKLNIQRALGIGSVDKSGKWHDVSSRFEEQAARLGIDAGQLAGSVDAAKYTVGWGNRFKGQKFLNKQFGGFANAAQVYGAGQEFGSGDALLRAFAGKGGLAGGRGGIDPLASSKLAETVTGQMYGSRYGAIQGEGLTAALGSMVGMGENIGEQMRLARGAGMGLKNLGESLAGATDPLQQAINAYAGADVFSGKFYQMNAMTQLSGGDLIEALRTGKVPDRLKDLGISMPQIREYAAKRNEFGLARYQMGQGSADMDSLVESARSAGGPLAFLREQLQGVTGNKKRRGKIKSITEQLGTAIAASTGGSTEETIRGLQVEAAADLGITGEIAGTGVGDTTSRKGAEQAARDAEADKKKKNAEQNEKDEKTYRLGFKVMGELPDQLQAVGKGLLEGEKSLTDSLKRLADYIDTKILKLPPKAKPKSNQE